MTTFDLKRKYAFDQDRMAYDTSDYKGGDYNQAMYHLQEFMRTAPPDMQRNVLERYFQQVPIRQHYELEPQASPEYYTNPDDPRQMAQSFRQTGQPQKGGPRYERGRTYDARFGPSHRGYDYDRRCSRKKGYEGEDEDD